MDNKCSIIKTIANVLLFLLLFVSSAYAFGITSDYNSQSNLVLAPGQSKQFSMVLQNMIGGEDLIAQAEIIEGKEFISALNKNEYVVSFGKQDVHADFKVSVNQIAPQGEHNISIMFKVSPKNPKEGMLQFNTGSEIRFKLIITGEVVRKKTINPGVVILVSVLVLLLIALSIWALRKRKNY